MSQKTILFDGRFLSLDNAGLGRYSCELLKRLLELDKKSKYILLVTPAAKFSDDLIEAIKKRGDGIEVVEFEAKHYSLNEQTKLLKFLNELKPDLVHFTNLNHPVMYKGKFVVTIHDLTLFQFSERANLIKKMAYNLVVKKAAQNANKILTVSNYAKKEIAKKFQIPENKIVVTYNGIDEKFQKITNPKSLQRAEAYGLRKPYILNVGQWRSHKNLLRLVEAFAKMLENNSELQSKIELVFSGKVDNRYPELPALIKKLKLTNYVKFTGFVEDDDLPVIYNDALLFAFPSLSEGFGLPGLEAQACAIPVVSSDKTCLPEILGRGALYFNPLSVDDMAKKMEQAIVDQGLRKQLIEHGLLNAKKFNWEDSAQKTLEVYDSLLYK